MSSGVPEPDETDESPLGRLRSALAGAGVELSARELSDALWLALHGLARPLGTARSTPDAGTRPHPAPPTSTQALGAGRPGDEPPSEVGRRSVYALTGTREGSGSGVPVRIPGVRGLPHPLGITKGLRLLKRRVPSLHRYELDENATAEAIADSGVLDAVLRPAQDRWLDLVLAVDDGLSMRLWHDTIGELTDVLAVSGIFRSVRTCSFETPAGVTGQRTVVLIVTDGVADHWHDGSAHARLTALAHTAPTALLHVLPTRLWSSTALDAEPMTVRTTTPAPPNTLMDAYDAWLPAGLGPRPRLPIPVLELAEWSLSPWAELLASHGGVASLRVVDAASAADPATSDTVPPGPAIPRRSAEQRVRDFQGVVSPQAYELAGHLAGVDPLTLPVMRVVQSAALPNSHPACLSEVLLSGLMHIEEPLDGHDVFAFTPDVRSVLRTVIRAGAAQSTIDAVNDFIEPRLGRTPDFPAVIAERTGTLTLPRGGKPFAELGPAAELAPDTSSSLWRAVAVRSLGPDGEEMLGSGYLIAERLVLTAMPLPATAPRPAVGILVPPSEGAWYDARVVWRDPAPLNPFQSPSNASVAVLQITDTSWNSPFPADPVRWGDAEARDGSQQPYSLVAVEGSDPPRMLRITCHDVRSYGNDGAFTARASQSPSKSFRGAAVFRGPKLTGVVTALIATTQDPSVLMVLSMDAFAQDRVLHQLLGREDTGIVPGGPLQHAQPEIIPRRSNNLPRRADSQAFHPAHVAWIRTALAHNGGRPVTLYGAPATGKSVAALEYAHLHLHDYTLVWWVRGHTVQTMVESLSGIAASTGFVGADAFETSVLWLERNPEWLLVFDDVEEPQNVDLLLSRFGTRGHVLVTMRDDVRHLGMGWGTGLSRELTLPYGADLDRLTGLPNGRALRDQLSSLACADPSTAPSHHTHLAVPNEGADGSRGLAVLFCDLDGFKSINDRFGHETGDTVLVEVARRLRTTARDADMVSRLGGDEFVVLADQLNTADATDLAVRLRNAIIPPIRVEGRAVRVGASFGITWASCDMTADEILASADRRSYVEKRSRRKRPRPEEAV